MNESNMYDLRVEGGRVIEQMKLRPSPIVEARNLMSQTLLAHVLLGLSDAGFYEYIANKSSFSPEDAIKKLNLEEFTFTSLLEYLLGCGIFTRQNDGKLYLTEKGKRSFNVYTRGVLNVYLGGYSSVLRSLGDVVGKKLALNDKTLRRSTRHAAAGTAYSTCAFTIPDVFDAMRNTNGKVCLDLGCGTGDFLLQWVLHDSNAKGIGVDMSADALCQARDTAQRWGVSDRLEFFEAEVGSEPLPIPSNLLEKVEIISAMYILHEFGRHGRQSIIDVLLALKAQLAGRNLLALEVEACDPEKFAALQPPPLHFGRLDYRLIHQLSGQGLPRGQEDWHSIFLDAGAEIVEPGKSTGGSLIYIVRL